MSADTQSLTAGREMDALVHQRLNGHTTFPLERAAAAGWYLIAAGETRQWINPPHYSTDMAAAWLVVEEMRAHPDVKYRNLSLVAYCYNRTYATFDAEALVEGYTPEKWAEANGEHATPLAICLAALLTLGAP